MSEAGGIQATCSLLSGAEQRMGLEAGCQLAFSPQLACLLFTELRLAGICPETRLLEDEGVLFFYLSSFLDI